ncbi:MAG: hypothetical protein IPK93_07305 [Solirubrobacterales bacterium]|nr:hypothetical protein [Solirubrobacterales bacterium]
MLILLGISTGIAIVVPAPKDDPAPEETTPPTGTTGTTGSTSSAEPEPRNADLVEAEIKGNDGSEPVRAGPGDRLVLTVDPGRNTDVEIPGLGLAGTATEFAPVVFDVQLPTEPGNFPVVETGDRELARIEISKAD